MNFHPAMSLAPSTPWRVLAVLCCWSATTLAMAQDSAAAASPIGTTIVGEQESAVGLYLMPWHEESPDDTDRPPALVDEPLQAVDTAQFDARVQTKETIAAFRRSALPRN